MSLRGCICGCESRVLSFWVAEKKAMMGARWEAWKCAKACQTDECSSGYAPSTLLSSKVTAANDATIDDC